ncbi:MAG: hypothetical protein WBQ21_12865 [Solirubrobacteraceae bacterium]
MSQLSRPFQIVLGAVLLLGLIGVIALRAHSSNPSEPSPASASAPSAVAPKAVKSVAAHKVSDPTTSARKATVHTTASRSHKVVVAHNTRSHAHTTAIVHKTPTHTTAVIVHKTTSSSHKTTVRSSGNAASPTSKRAPEQAAVEHELAQGKTVLLVFWNPRTSVDREVQAQARALASGSKGTVALHSALANQVGLFGSITEVVHVYQTPTILIVNRHGVVSTLTGLTDVFALQQAVAEAQHASN